ncbi:MAG: PAS domain-containing sensor histidine kinase [Candidatus Lokiarchaeia archaeon]
MCMYSSELKESEERYRLISENANDLIIVFNEKFEYEYINKNVHKRILGYAKEDLIGKNQLPFIHPNDRKQAIIAASKILRKGSGSHRMRFKKIDGHYKWLEITGKNFSDSKGNNKVLAIARDITERKEAEEKLKKSEEKYREAYNRAELYKDLFYHDINNICSNIKFSIDLSETYLNESGKEREIKDLYNLIREQFIKSQKLISNLQKISNLESSNLSLKIINASKTLEEAIQFIKNSLPTKNINFNLEFFQKEILVNADELLMDIFDNILFNAVNHNDNPQIEITIKISREMKLNKSYIKFEFKDNGIGMTDEKKGNLFQERFSNKKGSKGMGFGLTLVKKIINNYNGQIWVEDRVKKDYSKGSIFNILVPEAVK